MSNNSWFPSQSEACCAAVSHDSYCNFCIFLCRSSLTRILCWFQRFWSTCSFFCCFGLLLRLRLSTGTSESQRRARRSSLRCLPWVPWLRACRRRSWCSSSSWGQRYTGESIVSMEHLVRRILKCLTMQTFQRLWMHEFLSSCCWLPLYRCSPGLGAVQWLQDTSEFSGSLVAAPSSLGWLASWVWSQGGSSRWLGWWLSDWLRRGSRRWPWRWCTASCEAVELPVLSLLDSLSLVSRVEPVAHCWSLTQKRSDSQAWLNR